MEKLCISPGNSKLGPSIPSVSLPAIVTCVSDAPCAADCYDKRSYGRWPSVEKARQKNLRILKADRYEYFRQIAGFLEKKKPKMFRWHVGGDIVDQGYFYLMCTQARMYPSTKFLCFTKRHDLQLIGGPDNLSIIASMWPGWGDPNRFEIQHLPKAWMQDGTEGRVPPSAIKCSGGCETCGMCWNLKNVGRDVVFGKH